MSSPFDNPTITAQPTRQPPVVDVTDLGVEHKPTLTSPNIIAFKPESAPTLNTPGVVKDEPASQWASRTMDEMDKDLHSTNQTSESVASTPGLDMPGSFPRATIPTDVLKEDVQYVKEAAVNTLSTVAGVAGGAASTAAGYSKGAASTAAGYAGGAASTAAGYAGGAVHTVAQTVSNILPASVAAYIPTTGGKSEPDISKADDKIKAIPGDSIAKLPEESRQEVLPSHDDESNVPLGKSGGVGALPGTASETSVAKLPDERNNEAGPVKPFSGHSGEDLVSQMLRGGHAGESEDKIKAIPGESIAKLPEERRQEHLPSHDDQSGIPLGKTGGVGALPGTSSEHSVAKLPDEKNIGSTTDSAAAVPAIPSRTSDKDALAYLHPNFQLKHDEHNPPAPKESLLGKSLQSPEGKETPASQRADTDASTQTLNGHSTLQTPSPGLETNREHTKSGGDKKMGVFVSSAKDSGNHTASSKVLNTDGRSHPVGRDDAVSQAPRQHQAPTGSATSKPFEGTSAVSFVPGDRRTGTTSTRDRPPTPPAKTAMNPVGGATTQGHSAPHPSSNSNVGDSHKKPGFMDKVKGEVKVLSGKIGRNEEKQEEGRRLMGKN